MLWAPYTAELAEALAVTCYYSADYQTRTGYSGKPDNFGLAWQVALERRVSMDDIRALPAKCHVYLRAETEQLCRSVAIGCPEALSAATCFVLGIKDAELW